MDAPPKPITLQDFMPRRPAQVPQPAATAPAVEALPPATPARTPDVMAPTPGNVGPAPGGVEEVPSTQATTPSMDEPMEPAQDVEPEAHMSKADALFGGKRNKTFDAAHAAKRRQHDVMLRNVQKIIDARLNEDVTDPKWVYLTKREICKAIKRDEKTLATLIRYKLKIPGGLEALRRAKLGLSPKSDERHALPEGQQKPDTRTPIAKWNVLDLFDRLMQRFDVVEPFDAENEIEKPENQDRRATWVAWRVFLAAAFGLPPQELDYDHGKSEGQSDYGLPVYPGVDDKAIPRGAAAVPRDSSPQQIFSLCTGRQTWPAIRAKLCALIVGRRGGKSYITAIIGIYLATRTYRLKLGTRGMVMILARDKEQAGVIRGYIIAFLGALDELREQFADDPTKKLIELKNGITIEVRAIGDAGTRGYTVVAALMDEIAFWPTDPDSAKQDKKVLRALRPAMLGIANAMIVMLSSPYAKRGELYEYWRKGYGQDEQTRVLVWQADTLSMRPSDDVDLLNEIKEEYEDDPESAKAEYGAGFRTDLENIFGKAALEAVSVPGRRETVYRTGNRYRAFVDPSGGSADSYVIAVAHEEERTFGTEKVRIPVLDFIKEWTPPFDPEVVSAEVVQVCKRFHIVRVTGDAYAGEWPRDPLKKKGVQYELSEKTRSELYLDFLPVVNSARCELLDSEHWKRCVNQFANLERRVGRSGKDSVDHPPGGHDDVANAVAGVMVGVKSGARHQCTF